MESTERLPDLGWLGSWPIRFAGPDWCNLRSEQERPCLARSGGPRLLLRRLREVMAEPVSPQARLDKIVVHIAANMVAEVCSVYVLRADGRSNFMRRKV